jgi:protein SCO1/2
VWSAQRPRRLASQAQQSGESTTEAREASKASLGASDTQEAKANEEKKSCAAAAQGDDHSATSGAAAAEDGGVTRSARASRLRTQHLEQHLRARGKDTGDERPGSSLHGPVTWLSLALMTVMGTGVVIYYRVKKRGTDNLIESRKMEAAGAPQMGGPWANLVDSSGAVRSSADFHGKYVLIYFGFSHCPDICPNELKKMASAMEAVDSIVGPIVQPLFITVDPARDTPERLEEYKKELFPRTICLTGKLEDIMSVARRFRVYFSAPKDTSGEYQVDHSIFFYLVDPDGKFMEYYGKDLSAYQVASRMASRISSDIVARRDQRLAGGAGDAVERKM